MIAINPSDLDAIVGLGLRCVVYGLMFSGIPLLVGMLIGAVYRSIEGRG